MLLEEIQEQLAEIISYDERWVNKLDDSTPGHYGVEDWDIQISDDDIWVDIPNRKFSFKNAQFSFKLRLGGSSDDDSIKDSFSKPANGHGTFEFTKDGKGIELHDLEIDFELDLYAEEV